MAEFLSPVTPSAGIFLSGQTLFSRLTFSLRFTTYIHITWNKNVLSSVESRLLGAHGAWRKVLLSKAVVLLRYFFVLNIKRVLCHNVNTQNVKVAARRDEPHIQLSFTPVWNIWNLLHVDIAPVRRTLSGNLHSNHERWFLSVQEARVREPGLLLVHKMIERRGKMYTMQ